VNEKDWRDYATYVFAAAILTIASAYIFTYPNTANFATWAAVCGTLATVLRWLDIRDDKEKDCER